jgi:hypothetical protein
MTVRGVAGGFAIVGAAPGLDPSAVGAVPVWVKVGNALSHVAFQTAAATISLPLFNLAPAGVIHAVKIKHSAAFVGGAIATYTMSVGIAGTLAKYATAFDVFQAPSNTAFQMSSVLGSENNGANTSILVTAVCTGANLSASTGGVVDIWALLSKCS